MVSVVPEGFPRVPPKLDKLTNSLLTGRGGHALRVLGSYVAELIWQGKRSAQRLYVIQSLSIPLLGFPALQVPGVARCLRWVATTQPKHHVELFKGLGMLKDKYQIGLKPEAYHSHSETNPYHIVKRYPVGTGPDGS